MGGWGGERMGLDKALLDYSLRAQLNSPPQGHVDKIQAGEQKTQIPREENHPDRMPTMRCGPCQRGLNPLPFAGQALTLWALTPCDGGRMGPF